MQELNELQNLSESEVREVITRAAEIQSLQGRLSQADDLIAAAEEAGLSKDAVIEALRERVVMREQFKVGQFVFAPSTDNWHYVAKINEIVEGVARIQFVSGAEVSVHINKLQPFAPVPGQKLSFHAKDYGGWMNARVTGYNPISSSIQSSLWGDEQNYTLDKVRMRLETQSMGSKFADSAMYLYILMGAAGGALITAGIAFGMRR